VRQSGLGEAANGQAAAGSGLRWRPTLQRRWERKLEDVIALAGACQGMSAAGDVRPGDGAALPSFQLYCRTAAALEDLAAIADAIHRADAGAYGLCDRCKRQITDHSLSRDPLRQYCAACSLRGQPCSG
jgi:DnaK suppressor protein